MWWEQSVEKEVNAWVKLKLLSYFNNFIICIFPYFARKIKFISMSL
jgi:hypothetical protein